MIQNLKTQHLVQEITLMHIQIVSLGTDLSKQEDNTLKFTVPYKPLLEKQTTKK